MNRISKLAVRGAGAAALAILFTTSTFADSRPLQLTDQDEVWRMGASRNNGQYDDRRDNRVTVEGRVQSVTHERDGYRVQLDRGGYSYWVPELSIRNAPRNRGRMSDLRVGVSIRLGGILGPRSVVNVDVVDWLGDEGYYDGGNRGGYDRGYERNILRGTVERVDFRRGVIVVRDGRSGRFVTAALRRGAGYGRGLGIDDVRRGDRIALVGSWTRGDIFDADRIDSVRTGRY